MPPSKRADEDEILLRLLLESLVNPPVDGKSPMEEVGRFACQCADFFFDDVSVNENSSLYENGSDHISDSGSLYSNDDGIVLTEDTTRDLGTSVPPESSSTNDCPTRDASMPPLKSARESEEEVFCRLILEALANSQHEMAGKLALVTDSVVPEEVKSHFERIAGLAFSCADFVFDDVPAEDKQNCNVDENGNTDQISDNGRLEESDCPENGGFDIKNCSSNSNRASLVYSESSERIPGEGPATLYRIRAGTTGGSASTGPAAQTNEVEVSLITAADKTEDIKAPPLDNAITKEEQDLEESGSLGQSLDVSNLFRWTGWNPFTENVTQTEDVDKSSITTEDKIEDNKTAPLSITDAKEEPVPEDSGSFSRPGDGSVMSYLYVFMPGMPCLESICQNSDEYKTSVEEADKMKADKAAPLDVAMTKEEQNPQDSGCLKVSLEEGFATSYEVLTRITCDSPSAEQVSHINNEEECLALVKESPALVEESPALVEESPAVAKVVSKTTMSVSWTGIDAANKLENNYATALGEDTTKVQGQTPIKEADKIKGSKAAPLDIAVSSEGQNLEDSGYVERSPKEVSVLSNQILAGMTGYSPSVEQFSQIKNENDPLTLVKVNSRTTYSVTGAAAEATDKLEDKDAAPLIVDTIGVQGREEEQVLEEWPSVRSWSEEGLATCEKETGVKPALTSSESKVDVTTPDTTMVSEEESVSESVSIKIGEHATNTEAVGKRRIVKLANFSFRRKKNISDVHVEKDKTSRGEERDIRVSTSKPKKLSQRRKVMKIF
jgi:hypothetical protein